MFYLRRVSLSTSAGRTLAACVISGGLLSSACGGDASEDEPEVETAQQAILYGTLPPAGTDETNGFVLITHGPRYCSGTLIRNDMVLTARHCLTTDNTPAGPLDNLANFTLKIGTQVRSAHAMFANSTTNDSAMLQTADFFSMNGKRYDFERNIYAQPRASLIGSTLACFGYGSSACGEDPNLPSPTGRVLRVAALPVADATTSPTLIGMGINSLGQTLWKGDSGGSCLSSGVIVGISALTIGCGAPAGLLTADAFRPWALGNLLATAAATVTTASASNTTGNRTLIDNADANGNPNAIVQVTQNWNPASSAGVYNPHNVGVSYVSASGKWAVQNKDGAPMPLGASFNVSAGGSRFIHTAAAGNTVGHLSRIDSPLLNGLPNQMLVVTPNESGAANNHPTGIFYDTSVAKWSVFNEDFSAMPPNAKFNIRVVVPGEAYYKHTTSAANVFGPWTYLDQPNLNNQPSAQFLIAQDYGAPGFSGVAVNHPLGVFYDSNAGKWAIFTQTGGSMPVNARFHILIRP